MGIKSLKSQKRKLIIVKDVLVIKFIVDKFVMLKVLQHVITIATELKKPIKVK